MVLNKTALNLRGKKQPSIVSVYANLNTTYTLYLARSKLCVFVPWGCDKTQSPLRSKAFTHQQTPESETTLLISDGVLTVEAAVSLTHRLHGHVSLCVAAQGLHRSVAAANKTIINMNNKQVECFLKRPGSTESYTSISTA